MIAVVRSLFNTEITEQLLEGCIAELKENKLEFRVFNCPGAVETVGYTRRIIDKLNPAAVIVLGAIIKGDTDHYEYVCDYAIGGHSHLAGIVKIPVIFGILTTQNEELAIERASVQKMNKGKEFAQTAIYMINAFENV